MVNNQPSAGLFTIDSFPVMDSDSVSSLARRLHRMDRNIKDPSKVSLFRYDDPVLGPRKMPTLVAPLEGKTQICPSKDKFKIDVESQKVSLESEGKSIDIGDVIVYRV